MKTIYKYQFFPAETVALEMPDGAQILSLQQQNAALCFWAFVDTDQPPVTRNFCVFGTGHEIPADFTGVYVGTVQQPPYVWHVFEV